MKLYLLSSLFLITAAFAEERSSETLDGRKGLFRLLSANILEETEYHFRTSLEFFQQDELLKDIDNSSVRETKATLAFGYGLTPNILLTGSGGFNFASRQPRSAGSGGSGTDAIDIIRGSIAATGYYDIGKWMKLAEKKLTAGFSLWIDFSKISRFVEAPNVVPTFILTGDFTDNKVLPARTSLNVGFRPANGKRFYDDSAHPKDYDRFVTDTINSWAWTAGLGVDFPFEYVIPSVELHIQKTQDSSFANTPKWVTAGLKGNPFPTKNIEIFGAVDLGLSSFTPTVTGRKPDAPVVPLWNAVLGFGVSRFGFKQGEVTVSQADYNKLKHTVAEQDDVLQGLKHDLEYNVVQGRVIDAATKLPMAGVTLSFPETPDLKVSKTDAEGKFVRYFKALSAARMVVSTDGYDPSSKFLSLKPGERVNVDIELRKANPNEQLAEFVATVTTETGGALIANVSLTDISTGQAVAGSSDASGQVSLKVPQGTYRLDIKAPNMKTVVEMIDFQKGKTILRSYSLAPVAKP